MALRDTLRKAASLLVELPPEDPAASGSTSAAELDQLLAELGSDSASASGRASTKTVEQIVQDADGPNLDEIAIKASAIVPTAGPDGKMQFAAIYQQSGLPTVPFTAEQMLDMLNSLPVELPLDTKRQTVKVTLGSMGKSIGATPETIVADASRKLAALTAFMENLSKETAEFITTSELEIAALQAQIEEKRKSIQATQEKQAQARQMCDAESDRLDDVLEFFSLDVPPSKYAPPGSEQKAGGSGPAGGA
jgi:hypothetical protein